METIPSIDKPDILPIIEAVTPVRQNKALCPFHDDRNPSLVVNARTQTYRCYGCHAHGDVIDFVQRYRNLSFKEALSYLGISSKTTKSKRHTKTSLIRELKELEIEIHYCEFMKEYSIMLGSFMRLINGYLLANGVETDFSDLNDEEYHEALPEALKKATSLGKAHGIKLFIDMQREYGRKLNIMHGRDRQAKKDLYVECMRQGAANE